MSVASVTRYYPLLSFSRLATIPRSALATHSMVADTFHVQSSQPVRASGTLFGQDIGKLCLFQPICAS